MQMVDEILSDFSALHMMTSSNWIIFCIVGPLWGESTGHRWILVQSIEQTEEMLVIWDAIALIVTSQQLRV